MDKEELISRFRDKKRNDEFEELFNKYVEGVKANSGGIVETNKAEFIKQYTFYAEVIHPRIMEMFNMILK